MFLLACMVFFFITGCRKTDENYCPPPPLVVTDIDGNKYHTVAVGNQVWLAENLRVAHYRNGDPVLPVTSPEIWSSLTTGAYCSYLNLPENALVYGYLYNGYAILDDRNICPAGWHVPSEAEWFTLIRFLGGEMAAGGKLKEAGLGHWENPNTGAENGIGFTALPAGYRNDSGVFGNQKISAIFWSSSGYNTDHQWYHYLYYNYQGIYRDYFHNMQHGFSIRCIYDYVKEEMGKK